MKISIITTTYNSASTIKNTLESVNSQTYANIEHIIVDGLSTDNTLDVIKKYGKRVSKVISEKDDGIYDAMNKGIKAATGDVIGILNSDDFYMSDDAIKLIVSEFTEKGVDAVYTNLFIVDAEKTDKIIRECKYESYKKGFFKRGWHPPHPTLFVRKNVYDAFGLFDTTFKIAADYDFMLRVFEKGNIKSSYLPVYTLKMRNGGASTNSISNIKLSQKECLQSLEKNDVKYSKILYFAGKYYGKIKQYSYKSFINDFLNKN